MARTVRQRVALGVVIAFASVGINDLPVSKGLAHAELGAELNGKKLFEKETFGGNGRTCQTCHSKHTGTLGLADVQRIIDKADPGRHVPDSRRARRRRSRHDAGPSARHHRAQHPAPSMGFARG